MNRAYAAIIGLATVLLLTIGAQSMYIVKVNRESAAWAQRVAADSVRADVAADSLSTLAQVVAERDSTIATLRVAKSYPKRTAARAAVIADVAKPIARDTSKADSVRLASYEAAVSALEVEVKAQAEVIGYQEREIAQLEAVRVNLEQAVQVALNRVAELEQLIADAPAVQAPKGGGVGGVLKTVGSFLAGVGVGIVAGLVLK